jgi:hypothetical protein
VKRILPILIVGMTLSGCQEMAPMDVSTLPPEERKAVEALSWLQDADAARDAAEARQQGDLRLLALAVRAPNLPGVPAEATARVERDCGIRYLEGTTDMVRGDNHLKLLQQARDYAAAYNRLMLEACLTHAD